MTQTWSHSRLSSYLLCAEAYRRRYVMGERSVTTRMHIGSALARVAEHDATAKLSEHRCLTLSESVDLGVAEYEALTATEPPSDPENIGPGSNHAAGAARCFHKEVSPELKDIVCAEKRLFGRVRLPFGAGKIILEGKPDIVVKAGVGDQKTGRKWKAADLITNRQLPIYELLHAAEWGELPKTVWVDNLFRTGRGTQYKAQRLHYPAGSQKARIRAALAALAQAKLAVDKEIFLPPPAGFWKCDPAQCGYYDTCIYTGGISD